MSPRLDLTNQVFGDLTVIKFLENRSGRSFWLCRCICGKLCEIKGKYLSNGDTKSCGCRKVPHDETYYLTTKFGKLQPIKRLVKNWKGRYECLCDCGTLVTVESGNLLSGNTTSCGCLAVSRSAEIFTGEKFSYLLPIDRQNGQIRCKCDCGNFVFVDASELLTKKRVSCGCKRVLEAKQRWTTKSYTKEDIAQLRRQVSSAQRVEVYKRDNYKCIVCGSTKTLQAHHVIPVLRDASISNITDLTNCVTLCAKCHLNVAHSGQWSKLNESAQTLFLTYLKTKLV